MYKKLYLDASAPKDCVELDHPAKCYELATEAPATEGKASYDPATEEVDFDLTVPEDVEITGYMSLHLFVSCDGYDDMDLFVNIQKASEDGTWVPWLTLDEPHPGAWGKCRVSRATVDAGLTKKHTPVYTMTDTHKLEDGEVRAVDIAIVPTSRVYHKGERFRVQISGRYIRDGWFEPLSWDTDNRGTHNVHTGGEHASWIEVPVVPPRYQAGSYIHR